MKLLILFVFAAVALAAVLAEPLPGSDYDDDGRRNVKVVVERRPVVKGIIEERRIPVIQRKVLEIQRQRPRKVIVVKKDSYDGSDYGYGRDSLLGLKD